MWFSERNVESTVLYISDLKTECTRDSYTINWIIVLLF